MNIDKRFVAGMFTMALAAPTLAAPPSDQQIDHLQQLMGFDTMIGMVADKAVTLENLNSREPDLTRLQSVCMIEHLKPQVRQQLQDMVHAGFKELFVNTDTAQAWLDFSGTKAGDRLLSFMREAVQSAISGRPTPDPEAAFADLSEQEAAELLDFKNSVAGEVMNKSFPDVPGSGEFMDTLRTDVMSQCGIEQKDA